MIRIMTYAALVAILFTSPVYAASTKIVQDNLGHRYVVDEGTAAVPGAGSGLGSILGVAADSATVYPLADWDIEFGFYAEGSNNDSGSEEVAIAAISAFKYFGSNLALGVEFSRPNLAVNEVMSFAPVAKLAMWRNPTDSHTKGLLFRPFDYSIATGENDMLSGGAFSFKPTLQGYVEFPLGWGAGRVSAGPQWVATEYSADPADVIRLKAGFTIIWWAKR